METDAIKLLGWLSGDAYHALWGTAAAWLLWCVCFGDFSNERTPLIKAIGRVAEAAWVITGVGVSLMALVHSTSVGQSMIAIGVALFCALWAFDEFQSLGKSNAGPAVYRSGS